MQAHRGAGPVLGRWHSRAMDSGVPPTPKTWARATARAALEERPAPTGRVDSMVSVPPEPGRARAAMAATSRAHGGSSRPTTAGSGTGSSRISAGWSKASEVTTNRGRPSGVSTTVTPRSMAMGRARPWL